MTSPDDRQMYQALWRHRAGWLPESRVAAAIGERLKRLAARSRTLEGRAPWLRTLPGDAWRAQDEAHRTALRALDWGDFESCIRRLLEAEHLLDEMAAAVAADEALAAADEAWEQFLVRLDLADFAACPTLRIPHRLGRLGRELLNRGETRPAIRVGSIRDATCAALRAEEPGRTGAAGDLERLDTIRKTDPQRGRRLEELRRRGLQALASRLADDLEARLAGRAQPGVEVEDLSGEAETIRRRLLQACRPLEE